MDATDTEEEQPAVRMARLLRDKLVPDMVARGVFGADWRAQSVEAVPIGGLGEDHWASTTLSTTLQLVEKNSNAKKRTVALVTKCMLPSDGFEGYSQPTVMADNEVAVYNKILPFLERLAVGTGATLSDLYPKCYFAQTNMEELLSLTVMQDLRASGYFLAKARTALDKEHVMVAMRTIGRYHAFSHAAKARCRKEFLEAMVPLLREPVYTPAYEAKWCPTSKPPMLRGLTRAQERLQRVADPDGPDGERHQRRLERLARMFAVVDNSFPVMKGAVTPREPNAVMVHGDFCRNNMSFHYSEDGVPDAACLFDFQTTRYCSPAVDLSFFIFLNTSAALRAQHWDDLFVEYFNSLKATLDRLLDGHPVDKDFVMPTLEAVREEFRRHALFAFTICSFFLPQMMISQEDIMPIDDMKKSWETDEKAMMAFMLSMGGEKATEALADMVMDYLDRDLVP